MLRISPSGVQNATDNNLVNFFDAPGRDTFDISDLLWDIGFRPEVQLVAKINFNRLESIDLLRDLEERQSINFTLRNLQHGGEIRVGLSGEDSSLERSLRGRNRLLFKHVKFLKRKGVLKDTELLFRHRERGLQKFSGLSSGEQTLISTFLFLKSNLQNLDILLVDEPENSLHPMWQRKYLEFIHMAIGYSDARIIVASHSPIIVSGGLSAYREDAEILSVRNGRTKVIKVDEVHGEESVEEILFEAFDTITPASTVLSEFISEITWDVQEGRLSKSEAISKLENMRNRSYSKSQDHFILACIKVIRNI